MKQALVRGMWLLALAVVVMPVVTGCGNTDATQTASHHANTTQVTLRITGMS